MSDDVDARISRLLDQLENPRLSPSEIARIQQKVQVLESQRVMQT